VKLGVAFTWHSLAWEELASLVERAEARGYAAVYVDGDVSMLGRRADADVLDGWTVTAALLARTRRIAIGSIRLVEHWNAARLAQVAATAERIAPGRLQFFVSIGDRPEDSAFGFPRLPVEQRIAWLDETLDAVRALWRGESVTRRGRFVRLDAARVRPAPPPGALPIEIGARGPALLRVVARHADIWNVNLPAIPARVAAAAAELERACRDLGRPPDAIRRRLWMFARPGSPASAALAEFRRFNPWFAGFGDAEVEASLVAGGPAECRERIRELGRELALELPIVDLSGLEAESARESLESLPVGNLR
jgi:alkanesulfonate monooxygenase SsuD/methylene tetrahydromethanopterin reductase-like flavin-dependent oxidoreductase (luciferase family)